jgi:hypothetical protein
MAEEEEIGVDEERRVEKMSKEARRMEMCI